MMGRWPELPLVATGDVPRAGLWEGRATGRCEDGGTAGERRLNNCCRLGGTWGGGGGGVDEQRGKGGGGASLSDEGHGDGEYWLVEVRPLVY